MRISIPGLPGLYYDTDADSAIATTAFTAIGRKAPKPQGYAVQLLPYLWSFEVDLREVPADHPIQYLHPEGARSLGTLARDPAGRAFGTDLEALLRFAWAVNRETEDAVRGIVGGPTESEGVVIEIEDGRVTADGEELETDEFDVDEPTDPELDAFEGGESTTIDVDEGPLDDEEAIGFDEEETTGDGGDADGDGDDADDTDERGSR